MRRRRILASWCITSAFLASCLVAACQSSVPERHAPSASALEEESIDPIDLDGLVWREVPAPYPLFEHTTTPAPYGGDILVIGGLISGTQENEAARAAYLFSPPSGTWTAMSPLADSRSGHAAFVSGWRVIVAGGHQPDTDAYLNTSEVHYWGNEGWFKNVGSLSLARAGHVVAELGDGRALVIGGYDDDGVVSTVDLFDVIWRNGPWLPEGRTGHTAVTLPSGSIIVTGGHDPSYVPTATNFRLANVASGEWEEFNWLSDARVNHTATVLADGKVLVSGGRNASNQPMASVELLEEVGQAIGPFATQPPAPMHLERAFHTAGLLPDGRVIVVGGRGLNGALNSTEIYDPETRTWSLGPTLSVARSHHSMIVQPARVIVFGGQDDAGDLLDTVEILEYGKANGETCSEDAVCVSGHCVDGVCCDTSCEGACVACTATLKGSGIDGVCEPVADGTNPRSQCGPGMICEAAACEFPTPCPECEDLGTTWRLVPAPSDLGAATATALDDGRTLVTEPYGELRGGLLFTPGADTWTPVPTMVEHHDEYTATKLLDGRVLVMGGWPAASELFDPTDSMWTVVRTDGVAEWTRVRHTDVLAPDGRVLIIGGSWEGHLGSVEIYDPNDGSLGSWSVGPTLPEPRALHTATVLPDGRIFVAGGEIYPGELASGTFVLEPPYDGEWETAPYLDRARNHHSATLLPDGRVLIVGGYDGLEATASAEIVEVTTGDPETLPASLVEEATSLRIPRAFHTAARLPDGRVIVIGGVNEFGPTATTEIYDPHTDSWKYGPSLNEARWGHKMAVSAARIVVVGGHDRDENPVVSAEILDLSKGLGEACSEGGECISGSCVDGVCCDTSCEGACVACTATLKGSGDDGVCGAAAEGTNPRALCEEQDAATCGSIGVCDGAGSCAVYEDGTVCGDGKSCQAGECVTAWSCEDQPDGTECGQGRICQAGECVSVPTECANQADGTICDEGDGCTVGICRDGACVETYRIDGTRCEGGVCIAGQCKLDPTPTPPSGAGGDDGSSGGPDGEGPGSGRGSNASADGDGGGGGCSLAPSPARSSTLAMGFAILAAAGLLRRRA